MWPHCMMEQPHHHGSFLCSIRLIYQLMLLILNPLQLVKVIFHCQIQKLTKESGDLEEELDFTLCTNINGSIQVITCLHLEQAHHSCMSFYTLRFMWLTCMWPCALPCGLACTFYHLLNSSTFHRVVLLSNYSIIYSW